MIKIEGNVSASYRNRDEDLNFITIKTEENIDFLRQVLDARKRTDMSFWMIDVSFYETLQKAYQDLNDLHIDIDDDFYLIKEDLNEVDIWEIYKISPMLNITTIYYGNWTRTKPNESSLHLDQETKAWRRHNLNGYHFKVTTQESKPYITELSKNLLQGIFGDIFEELKVYFRNFLSWCLLLIYCLYLIALCNVICNTFLRIKK